MELYHSPRPFPRMLRPNTLEPLLSGDLSSRIMNFRQDNHKYYFFQKHCKSFYKTWLANASRSIAPGSPSDTEDCIASLQQCWKGMRIKKQSYCFLNFMSWWSPRHLSCYRQVSLDNWPVDDVCQTESAYIVFTSIQVDVNHGVKPRIAQAFELLPPSIPR